jgi:hypothetical protein
MEKKIKLQVENIDEQWYVVGSGIKIPVPTQDHANAVSRYLMTAEVPDPNFNPGRRKKSV